MEGPPPSEEEEESAKKRKRPTFSELEEQVATQEQEIAKLRGEVDKLKRALMKALSGRFGSCEFQRLPFSCQDDKEFVTAASRERRGSVFAGLPAKWKLDPEVACSAMLGTSDYGRNVFVNMPEACKLEPKIVAGALRHGLIRWEAIPTLRLKRNPIVVKAALQSRRIDWDNVPLEIQLNCPSVALYGLQHGYIQSVEQCPCVLERDFLRDAIRSGEIITRDEYDLIPEHLQDDLEFARNALRHVSFDVVLDIFRRFPQLRQDQIFWSLAVKKSDMRHLLRENAVPRAILSNEELMFRACCTDISNLDSVDLTLLNGRSFLEKLLALHRTALLYLPQAAQRLHPDIVRNTLEQYCLWLPTNASLERRTAFLATELFEDRAFVLKYFEAGLPFVEDRFPAEWRNDREIFLLIAKHCRKDCRRESFSKASLALRDNKAFMLEALEHSNSLLQCATVFLQHDFDIIVRACAGPCDGVEYYLDHRNYDGQDDIMIQFRTRMARELNLHKTFCATVLHGISSCSGSSEASSLSVLNQGEATSVSLKMLIAQYLDVPIGKRLRLLRTAHKNLSGAMKNWRE